MAQELPALLCLRLCTGEWDSKDPFEEVDRVYVDRLDPADAELQRLLTAEQEYTLEAYRRAPQCAQKRMAAERLVQFRASRSGSHVEPSSALSRWTCCSGRRWRQRVTGKRFACVARPAFNPAATQLHYSSRHWHQASTHAAPHNRLAWAVAWAVPVGPLQQVPVNGEQPLPTNTGVARRIGKKRVKGGETGKPRAAGITAALHSQHSCPSVLASRGRQPGGRQASPQGDPQIEHRQGSQDAVRAASLVQSHQVSAQGRLTHTPPHQGHHQPHAPVSVRQRAQSAKQPTRRALCLVLSAALVPPCLLPYVRLSAVCAPVRNAFVHVQGCGQAASKQRGWHREQRGRVERHLRRVHWLVRASYHTFKQ